MPPHATRTIFVANIPYDVSEEQLANVFSEAGPVSNVEIKFDPQTGRSKGYAFVQFYDDSTAASAVRNLSDVQVNGRTLRVEASTDEPGPRRRGGPGGPGGGGGGGSRAGRDETPPQRGATYGRRDDFPPGPAPGYGGMGPGPAPSGMGVPPASGGLGGPSPGQKVDLGMLPPGVEVGGQKATDAISKTLAAISPGQMQDVMAGMKTLIATQPEQARQLLQSKPQLAYALFQAMLLMNIVDPSVLQRITPMPPAAQAPTPVQSYPPPPPAYPTYPPAPQTATPPSYPPFPPAGNAGYRPPVPAPAPVPAGPPGGGFNAPPSTAGGFGAPAPPIPAYAVLPGPPALPPQAQAQLATLPEDQRAMLMQVLQLTPDQISALDAGQRDSIMLLRRQFLGAAA